MPRCTQPQGQAALDGLVRRLAPDLANVEAMVLDGPAVNAYALPGGRIVLMRGLLDQAGDSAEVAGILAHELGHVSRNHAMRALARAMGLQLLTGYVTGYAGLSAPAAGAAVLSGSRGFEAEADVWAAAALERSGIGTGGLRDFLTRIADREGREPAILGYLSTHPPTGRRLSDLPPVPARGPALDDASWAALRGICGSRPPGSRPVAPPRDGLWTGPPGTAQRRSGEADLGILAALGRLAGGHGLHIAIGVQHLRGGRVPVLGACHLHRDQRQ